MTLNLSEKFVSPFVSDKELEAIKPEVEAADKALRSGTGAGAEMLGWLSSEKYDRTEYDRIKKAAEKIRKSCDIFIVIGIGGSYLGSRAVIEFLRSPRHNRLVKDAPEMFFSGCNISSSDLSELLELCEGRDVCINVISKSGTTTEPPGRLPHFPLSAFGKEIRQKRSRRAHFRDHRPRTRHAQGVCRPRGL